MLERFLIESAPEDVANLAGCGLLDDVDLAPHKEQVEQVGELFGC